MPEKARTGRRGNAGQGTRVCRCNQLRMDPRLSEIARLSPQHYRQTIISHAICIRQGNEFGITKFINRAESRTPPHSIALSVVSASPYLYPVTMKVHISDGLVIYQDLHRECIKSTTPLLTTIRYLIFAYEDCKKQTVAVALHTIRKHRTP